VLQSIAVESASIKGYRAEIFDERGASGWALHRGLASLYRELRGTMTMDTDQLIKNALPPTTRPRAAGELVLMLALLAAAPVSLLMFFTDLASGRRHDRDAQSVL